MISYMKLIRRSLILSLFVYLFLASLSNIHFPYTQWLRDIQRQTRLYAGISLMTGHSGSYYLNNLCIEIIDDEDKKYISTPQAICDRRGYVFESNSLEAMIRTYIFSIFIVENWELDHFEDTRGFNWSDFLQDKNFSRKYDWIMNSKGIIERKKEEALRKLTAITAPFCNSKTNKIHLKAKRSFRNIETKVIKDFESSIFTYNCRKP